MRVGSLFSGIGGLDLGLERAGMTVVFQCESDPWRRDLLAERFPGVPCHEDVREVAEGAPPGGLREVGGERDEQHPVATGRDGACDAGLLLAGGFPCQDVSSAGRRKGLAGERSGLFWEFIRVARSVRPAWVLLENVPGLLSSHQGRDFAVVLGALAELGYGVAWRILDSRFFGVPQRRRRVFILGALAPDDTRAAAGRCAEILSVGTRCEGHLEAGAAAREEVAGSLGGGPGGRGFCDDLDRSGAFVSAPLSHGSNPNSNRVGRRREDDENLVTMGTLRGHTRPGSNSDYSVIQGGVRRLTPTECERLQAFPDGWTALGADSRRYAALGDAVTVNVAEWIGRRLMSAVG